MAVLVTGAAGFIGAATSRALLERGTQVVGIDNLNDYYDPSLKQARLTSLQQQFGNCFRFEKVDYAFCGGVFEDTLVLSVRAAIENARAGEILRQVVGKMGRAGGHDRRAGGSIPLPSTAPTAIEEIQSELRRRFLKALKIEDVRGQRLVPLRDMLENLQS